MVGSPNGKYGHTVSLCLFVLASLTWVTANKAEASNLISQAYAAVFARGGAESAGARTDQEPAHLTPGNSERGFAVFLAKGCHLCHDPAGDPSQRAPALRGRLGSPLSTGEIVADLWNHAPGMWRRMREMAVDDVSFTIDEMSDLFAFLYYLRALDPAGDAERGGMLFEIMGCTTCHATSAREAEKAGLGVQYWVEHTSPIRLLQTMWNHAGRMESQIRGSGMTWPRFEGTDMADVIAYVRQLNPIAQIRNFEFGDPMRGEAVFEDGCAGCHSQVLGTQGLSGRASTLSEMAGRMWNHYPDMLAMQSVAEWPLPTLQGRDMSDLVAYLFLLSYFDEAGDPARGREVFVTKGCSTCHTGGDDEIRAVSESEGRISIVYLGQALWNHGPLMLEKMRREGIHWPRLNSSQVFDLAAYLRAAGLKSR